MTTGSESEPSRKISSRDLAAERWVLGLTEPLLPVDAKVDAHLRMVDLLATAEPVWTVAFTSVFLHGLVESLPADDPWRRVRFFVPGGPQRNPVALTEGAWAEDGREFGSVVDVNDLVIPGQLDQPEVDFITAGSLMTVPGWFTSRAGALVGAAGTSWRATFQTVCAQLVLRSTKDVFDDIERATSAALYRRRTYLGQGDETLPVHLFHSERFADRAANRLGREDLRAGAFEGATADVEVFDEYRFGASPVPPAAYKAMKIDFSDWDDPGLL